MQDLRPDNLSLPEGRKRTPRPSPTHWRTERGGASVPLTYLSALSAGLAFGVAQKADFKEHAIRAIYP